MPDAWSIASTALLVLGLSVSVAAWSYDRRLAAITGRRLRELLRERARLAPYAGGLSLCCLALAMPRHEHVLVRLFWSALAIVCAGQALIALRRP